MIRKWVRLRHQLVGLALHCQFAGQPVPFGVLQEEAARAGGNSPLRIAFKHVLPNMIPPLFVQATLTVATAIIVVLVIVKPF